MRNNLIIYNLLFLFAVLVCSLNYSYAQTNFCSDNKISNSTFDKNGDNSPIVDGWTFNPEGDTRYGWKEDRVAIYGSNLYIDRLDKYDASSSNISLCDNIPKKVLFDHFTTGITDATLTISLGGQELLVLSYEGSIANPTFNDNDVEISISGQLINNSTRVSTEDENFVILVKNYTGANNGSLIFTYERNSGGNPFLFPRRGVYLDNVEVYEAKPPVPPNPTQDTVIVCPGETFNLNTLLPNIDSDKVASWHYGINPETSKVQNPTAVPPGDYYLFQKYDCEGSCYSDPAVKHVTVVRETIDLDIIQQPQNLEVCAPTGQITAIPTVTAGSTTNQVDYQWQVSTNGTDWEDIVSGSGTVNSGEQAILSLSNLTTSMTGYKYRVIFTESNKECGITSNSVKLTVYDPLTITTQPQNIITCQDNPTEPTLIVEAEGGKNLTYQWQELIGSAWTDVSGAESPSFKPIISFPGSRTYRAVVYSEGVNCNMVTSNEVTVLVKENPTLTVPENMTVPADPGKCTALVNYNVTTTVTESITLSYEITNGLLDGQTGTGTGSGISFPEGINVIEITASNGCVDDIKNFTINVEDTQMPTIQCNSSDIIINTELNSNSCGRVYDLPDPTYSDNCNVTLSYKIIRPNNPEIVGNGIIPSDQMFPIGTSEIIYSVTDDGGNTVSCSYTVTVLDKTPPVLSGCPTQTVQFKTDVDNCYHTILASDIEGVITADDNCLGNVNISYEINGVEAFLPYDFPKGITTVTAIATDEAGNKASCTFDIQVLDDKKPKITTCPADIEEINGCNTNALAENSLPVYSESRMTVSESVFTANGGTATDNCPDALTYQYQDSKTNLSDPCRIQVTRLWYVIDASGNPSASCTQIIKIINKIAPEVPDFETKVVSCASELVDPPLPTVYDACGNELTAEFVTKVSQPTDIDCEGTSTYTYRFTDCANNSTDWKFTYIVKSQDFKDKMPSDNIGTPVNCTGNIVDVEPPPVEDNCGNTLTPTQVIITPSNYKQLSCYQGDVVFSYVYEDCSGTFSNTYKRIVKVENTIPPTGVVPDDVTYNCISDIPQANINDITGLTSTCGGLVNVSIQESNNGGEGCSENPYKLTRKYILTDCSGLTNTYTQTITVINNEAPIFTNCPGSISEEADDVGGNFAIITIPTPSATSRCGDNATVTYTLSGATEGFGNDITNQRFNVGVTNVQYKAVDKCGNEGVCLLQVTVRSNEAPVIDCPGDIVTSCYDDVPDPYTTLNEFQNAGGTVTDTDGIDASTFTLVSQFDNNISCPKTIVRTYRISDNKGHSANCAQTIIVDDNIAPNFIGSLKTLSIERCKKQDEPARYETAQELLDNGLISLSDNCTDLSHLKINSSETYSGTCPIVINRVYTIEDACGNQTSVTQELDINDTTPPTVSGTISLIEKPGCSISDFPNHVETVPELIEKYGIVNGTVQKAIEISDNCTPIDQMGLTYTQTITMGCPLILHRIYTISDKCGNETSISKVVHIYDNEAPTYTNKLRDKELDGCGLSALSTYPPVTTEAELEALGLNYQDNCTATEDLVIKFISDKTVSQTDCYTKVIRTYTISDACSNTLTISQTITISDNTPPVATTGTLSDDIVEGCSASEAPEVATSVSALEALGLQISDNCSIDSEINVSHEDILSGSCPLVIKRFYTLIDKCTNKLELPVQTITIQDTQAPILSKTSYTETIEGCSRSVIPTKFTDVAGLETIPGLQISDNCSLDNQLVVSSIDTDTVSGCTFVTVREYTITDPCSGKSVIFTHTINVADTESPIVQGNFRPFILEGCGSEVFTQAPNLTVAYLESRGYSITDCVNDNELIFVDEGFDLESSDDCSKKYLRKGFVVDKCGNRSAIQAEVIVRDTTPPVELPSFSIPENQSGLDYCFDDIPEAPEVSLIASQFTDTCSTVSAVVTGTPSGDDTNWSVTYRYTITDKCGNEATNHPEIIYSGSDKTAPVPNQSNLTEIIEQCATSVVTPTATDKCYGTVTATTTNPITFTQQGTYYINWKYTDGNENESFQTQKVTIDDTTSPLINCPTVESFYGTDVNTCGARLTFTATATDNCTTPTISYFIDGSEITFPHLFPVGQTVVNAVADDGNDNTSNCSFTVNVKDTQNPSISCPPDIVVSNDRGKCSTTITDIGMAEARDNCDIIEIVSDNGSRTEFPVGITTITWTTTDANGNKNSCTQFIIVEDNEKPKYDVPDDISYCVNNIIEANYSNTTNGDVNKPPDYYKFEAGYTGLDIMNVSDNCCATNTIAWSISPESDGTIISGTGQPSKSIEGKKLWLDVATENPKSSYTEKEYTITYVVVDCNGNSTQKTTQIMIKPRPKIIKVN